MWGQDGWPSSFFACLWTETKSRSISYTRKKRTRPISNHLDRTNLVNKGFIIWFSGKLFVRDTAGSPERARWLHPARSGNQSQCAIWFSLPARGASHVIRFIIISLVFFYLSELLFWGFLQFKGNIVGAKITQNTLTDLLYWIHIKHNIPPGKDFNWEIDIDRSQRKDLTSILVWSRWNDRFSKSGSWNMSYIFYCK